MPTPATRGRTMSRLWANDEELAKKDDDLTASRSGRQGGHHPHQWQSARTPRRSSLFRLVAYAIAIILLLLTLSRFLNSSPSPAAAVVPGDQPGPAAGKIPGGRPPPPPSAPDNTKPKDVQVARARTYNGPVKLPNLGQTLQAIGRTGGRQATNRNILFAAASLESASTLLPLACQMAMERQNYVHFAFVGRSDIPLKTLLDLNGLDASCQMILHDARPDHLAESSETRMALATAKSMKYIYVYMHPQAVLIDSTADEERYFLDGIRDQVRSMKAAFIELPSNPGTRISWITKLDSASLAAWDKVQLEIIVHAPARGVGNLNRLLNSLSQVDLGAISTPHLTIELPHALESQVDRLLAKFQWPPPTTIDGHRPRMLTLRHRIARQKLSEEESSVRFLESFWPQNPVFSHVLVLSPHTEVTPQFFHYVKYALLHYRYSNAAALQNWGSKMMGLGFGAPMSLLDGSEPLTLPKPSEEGGSAFLWQAPSSDAMLFTATKWVELHGYVSRVLENLDAKAESPSSFLTHKDVSKKYPAWLEYVLQLARLRGYFTIYPGQETSGMIIGVHDDIPDVPEEHEDDTEAVKDAIGDLEDEASYVFIPHWQVDMLQTLPRRGTLPHLSNIPLMTWDGKSTTADDMVTTAGQLAAEFRRDVGHCKDEEERKPDRLARDLFC